MKMIPVTEETAKTLRKKAIKIWLDVRYSTFNIQILNVEYRISNSIQHSNRMLNIEYQTKSNIQIECQISNIKLNLTFKF